jgi:hypothetical protein
LQTSTEVILSIDIYHYIPTLYATKVQFISQNTFVQQIITVFNFECSKLR